MSGLKNKFVQNALRMTIMGVYLAGGCYTSYKLGLDTYSKPDEKFGIVKGKEGYSFGFTKEEKSFDGSTALDDKTQRGLFYLYLIGSSFVAAGALVVTDKKFGDKKSEPSAPQLVV